MAFMIPGVHESRLGATELGHDVSHCELELINVYVSLLSVIWDNPSVNTAR